MTDQTLTASERISLLRQLAARPDEHTAIVAKRFTHPHAVDRFPTLWPALTGPDTGAAVRALFELVHGFDRNDACGPCLDMGVVRERHPGDVMCLEHVGHALIRGALTRVAS